MDYKDLVRVPACFHKSPYYAVEEEVRLMMFDDSATVKARYSVENQEFEQEYNYRNDIITYHKLEIGEQNIHIFKPEVIIRRIELGFRHSEEFFKHFWYPFKILMQRWSKT